MRTAEERFWSKVDRSGGPGACWPWGAPGDSGYGTFTIGPQPPGGKRAKSVRTRAHRFAYSLMYGAIPDGLTVDHLCHNTDKTCEGGTTCQHRRCCNPAHLEATSIWENASRGHSPAAKNARKGACVNGHALDEANTYLRLTGGRTCRTCHRDVQRRRRGGPLALVPPERRRGGAAAPGEVMSAAAVVTSLVVSAGLGAAVGLVAARCMDRWWRP